MVNVYIKSVNLDNLKRRMRFDGLMISTVLIWSIASVLFGNICIEDPIYSLDWLLYTGIVCLMLRGLIITAFICDIVGYLFYLECGEDDKKIYL